MTLKEILTNQKILKNGLVLLFLLNLVDVATTLTLLEIARHYNIIASEVNPIMNYFLSLGYIPFILFKLCLSSFGCCLCWLTMKDQPEKYIKIGVIAVLIANTFYISILSCMIIRAVVVLTE